MSNYKLGSLFDGSGGFPLAGTLCGIEPVWAAEVEPYPIAVTRSRFPNMKHLGDISKVNGAEIEPVDIITFGSPCQDLSVAGKRAGLKHEANGDEETTRSGLFMEAVRIIKEMRKATNGKYPTFALWENVPGAFSSNKGEDFRIVCEELIKIIEPTATMPEVPQKGWNYADSYIGDGWSLAYRVLDAQYWGVPQRRRRIYLVADFRGERARQVLFEREGLRGYFAQGRTPWQGAPTDAEGSTRADDREGEGIQCFTPWDSQTRRCYGVNGVSPSLCAGAETSGQNQQSFLVPVGEGFDGYNGDLTGDKSATLGVNCGLSTGRNGVIERGDGGLDDVAYTLKIRSGCEGGGKGALVQKEKSATLACNNDQTLFQPKSRKDVIAIDKESYCSGSGFDRKPGIAVGGPRATLQAQGVPHAVCYETEPQMFENHSQDTRYKGPLETAQTVSATYGMGGNNQPFIVEPQPFCKSARGKFKGDAETWKDGKVANTLNTFDQGETRANELVVQEASVICLQGNGIDRADNAGCNGKGWKEDTSYTLNTIDRPTPKIDEKGTAFTLSARDYKNPQAVTYKPHYIVRRLTPTECARLQGFADWHGHLEEKTFLTDKEYEFWQEVRKTHATINGKVTRLYSRKQMLTWYNNLWTDAAEYKMWGNGIALPTALYAIQGIADALNKEESEIEDWML